MSGVKKGREGRARAFVEVSMGRSGQTWLATLNKFRIVLWLASLVVQSVKNPPTMQESGVHSLGREDPLKKAVAIHSIAWTIPWTEELGELQSLRSQRVGHDLVSKPAPRGIFRSSTYFLIGLIVCLFNIELNVIFGSFGD